MILSRDADEQLKYPNPAITPLDGKLPHSLVTGSRGSGGRFSTQCTLVQPCRLRLLQEHLVAVEFWGSVCIPSLQQDDRWANRNISVWLMNNTGSSWQQKTEVQGVGGRLAGGRGGVSTTEPRLPLSDATIPQVLKPLTTAEFVYTKCGHFGPFLWLETVGGW